MPDTPGWMHTEPQISVVIPTYNRAHLIGQTIDSVLAQGFEDFELIVVDDGSTDSTRGVVNRYEDPRIRYVYQDNAGGPAARNNGASQGRAQYLIFLDSDDILWPDALTWLIEEACRHPEAGLIGGGYQYINETGQVIGTYEPWLFGEQLDLKRWLLDCPFIPSATLIQRRHFEAIGGFDLEQEAAQDWDLWLRMAAAECPMHSLKRSICGYRLHSGSLTVDLERQKRGYLRALGKHFGKDQRNSLILAMRGEVYANAYLHVAAREYAAGLVAEAQEDLRQAAQNAPDWISSGVLLERLLRRGQSPIITDDYERYRSQVLENLPSGMFTAKSRRRAMARVAAASMFNEVDVQNRPKSIGLWWEVVLNDPVWLRNRGFWSIGLRSLVGPKAVSSFQKVLGR